LGGTVSFANGINNRGQVVGTSIDGQFAVEHAILWQNGTPTDLGTLGGQSSEAFAISDSGVVLGDSTTKLAPFTFDPFIYSKGTRPDRYPLLPAGTVFTSLAVSNNEINNLGQIICTGEDSNLNNRPLLLTPSDEAAHAIISPLASDQVDSRQIEIA